MGTELTTTTTTATPRRDQRHLREIGAARPRLSDSRLRAAWICAVSCQVVQRGAQRGLSAGKPGGQVDELGRM
jgi:hypothetical protein